MTNKEIAEILNISTATVSLAINNKKGVSEETRRKVLALYSNIIMSNLADYKKNNKRGKLLFCVLKKHGDVMGDVPFFFQLSESIYEKAAKEGYELQISHLMPRMDIDEYIDNLKLDEISGILIMATEILGEDIDRFKKLKKPFVVLDNWFYGREVDSVYMDNIDGIVKAVEHIYTKGHRRIGFIKSSFMINNFNERYYGYRIGLERVGLPFNEKLVYYAHSSNKGAYNDMIKQLKGKPSLPSALIVSNDLMAIGVIKALKEFGYHLPKDISLVGFDDMSDSHNIIPPLTSLRINHGMIAKRALEILLAKINSNPRSEGTYHSMITVDLIERESVYDLTNQST